MTLFSRSVVFETLVTFLVFSTGILVFQSCSSGFSTTNTAPASSSSRFVSASTPAPTPATSPISSAALGIYGPGIGGDALANTRLGAMANSGTHIQFMRFRAQQSSQLTSIIMYYLGNSPGYSGGTGGTWKLEVRTDDGTSQHFPSSTVLATQSFAALKVNNAGRLLTFASPATLTAGQIYHLVYTNTDADPENNYFSPDYWYYDQMPNGTADGRANPRYPDSDFAHGYYSDTTGVWVLRPGYIPILDIGYANGSHQGSAYGEASYGPGEVGQINGSSAMVREHFTVSGGDQTVAALGVRLLCVSGTDPLTVSLEDLNGNLIDSVNISAADIATGPAPDGTSSSAGLGLNAKWVAASFATSHVLKNGSTYNLRFSTASGTTYYAWVNRRLSEYGYSTSTYFSDGVAQSTINGSTWSSLGRSSDENNLQFYFTTISIP